MNEEPLSRMMLKDTSFQALMQHRIFNVLLIASPYDAFMMEEDGRVEEQLYNEYVALNLSSPPRVTRVSTMAEALEAMRLKAFDIVVAMPGGDLSETFEGSALLKEAFPNVPIVVLTPFSKEVSRRLANENLDNIDYVFSWLGNMDLLLAIIKLLEDKLNIDDITEVGVQSILLVEDSVRFYSSVLPHIYKFLLKQSVIFSTEALNQHEQMLRMRGRPKVMLARNYEEAVALYERFGKNMLGVISDVSFNRQGAKDSKAGLKLARWIRSQDPFLPIIVESSESQNSVAVRGFGGIFIDKNSKKLPVDLGEAIMNNFGFGDFIIREPSTGEPIMTIRNLKDMQQRIFDIPADSLLYHASRNDISRWLYSRALFPIADVVKQHHFAEIEEAPAVKQLFFDLIVKYRKMKNRGVVAVFQKDRFDHYSNFARIGQGSLGGKGRGLAFIDSIIKKNPVCDNFNGLTISIPRTVVLCTDIFDEFMAVNRLYPLALSDADDETILKAFLAADLPERLSEDFAALFDVVDRPFAVRSSSLLEDSHYQPFAGIYSTYMVPFTADRAKRMKWLHDAIKGVYASVFYSASKVYMTATSNVIDQEKMAVILQEVVGNLYGDRYYPNMSGVARSLNYYPIGDEAPEEGTVNLALGLGKYIVDGGMTLRFSPYHPNQILQTSEMEIALKETQTRFYALDLKNAGHDFSIDDGFNLLKLHVKEAEKDGALNYIASTYDPYDQIIRDGLYPGGRKVITFANILQHDVFPLARILQLVLKYGEQEMRRPVEIEFAATMSREKDKSGTFYLLQIRPIVDTKEMLDEDLTAIADEKLLLRSNNSLGHGIMNDLYDVVYVKTDDYSASHNQEIAWEIEKLNQQFLNEGKNYVLIGPGRWGSSDTWLGIPVKWPHISAARVIVEAGLTNYRVDPSQGTHFFQNLTSFGVGYFTINAYMDDGIYNLEFLNAQPAVYESKYLRHIRFGQPVTVKMDGKKKLGVVLLPGEG